MAVTLKDVAELAGVSRSAVSRTYTEGASVSVKTRKKVMSAATALGYSPNALASSLTTGRTKMIGLVSNNFHNPVFLEVFDLFTRGLQQRDLRPLLVNLTDETDPDASIRMLRQYSVDGVIVASSTLPPAFAKAFRDAGVPAVHSFGRHSALPDVDVLGIDNIAAGRLAARTLIERGYTEVGFLGGPADATSTLDREKGFLSEVALHKGMSATTSFANAYSFEAGHSEMTRLLKSDPAQAYFCADDVLSIGALSALQSARLRVPADVGLIGLNDMKMASWANINLTTIHNPFPEIIAASIERVAALVQDQDIPPQARLFDCSVVERGTLRPRRN
ncbi:LacI family transcriptional regulator [Litoreibacter meonggei]|uniref:LacI family transcriptional regulator n=1 Tax=Litoreibacter meonggei TaxID=1049199 RepID=A0A497VBH2_9RHOB|nr:LacI family DNA-binding transcriptional regulator [Litoreibacter meonggei]RLJ40931.1 LacI family transcriptional regulator [Litoreibacter meonggei]